MNISVNGRNNLDVSAALRTYAEDKIGKFDKYLSNITEAVVTLSRQKHLHKTEVLLKVDGMMIQAEGVTGEVYSSIDEVAEKLERRIRKFKGKLMSHRKSDARHKETPAPAEEQNAEEQQTEARIIKIKRFAMKPMNPDEAAMQMELLDKDFFIFTNDQSGDINVIYKRKDGNFGLIEPVR